MANIMTKRGSQDNVVTYEHICDTAADIAKIEKRYCTLGSVCIVINGDSGGLEVYMADSAGEWSAVMTGGTSSSGASLEIHPCSSNEIDSETGLPDIDSPSDSIIYLVPSGAEDNNNLYDEYIYVDGEWEKFGGATINLNGIPQADWEESDSSSSSYIQNKPNLENKINKYTTINKIFKPKTWNGLPDTVLNNFNASYVWTDGENTYYSNGEQQYVLYPSHSIWVPKTWNGISQFMGEYVWSDGDNIYCESEGTDYTPAHYILDKSTSTWSIKEWNGYTDIYASYIWSDGENIYFSHSADQYILDKTTSTWSAKTWNNLTQFFGNMIWTDGDNIYYSESNNQYILDKSTSTWSDKVWNGFIPKSGSACWTDGINVYYSDVSNIQNEQYILEKTTDTWITTEWFGKTCIYKTDIWSDSDNIYYSHGAEHYVLTLDSKLLISNTQGEFQPESVQNFLINTELINNKSFSMVTANAYIINSSLRQFANLFYCDVEPLEFLLPSTLDLQLKLTLTDDSIMTIITKLQLTYTETANSQSRRYINDAVNNSNIQQIALECYSNRTRLEVIINQTNNLVLKSVEMTFIGIDKKLHGQNFGIEFGKNATASSFEAIACGENAAATGQHSIAIGSDIVAQGDYSYASGVGTGFPPITIDNTEYSASGAYGAYSHAEGAYTLALGMISHAEGMGTIAKGDYSHVFGQWNVEDNNNYAEIVGNGDYGTRSNARALDWDGNEYLKGDIYVNCNADSTGGTKLESLPAVTSSDNNKVLEVVNGEWTVGSKKGTANGIASLDSNGKVPGEQIIRPSSRFNSKTWAGLTNFSGSNVWTDGTDIYYSSGSSQRVLNKSTSTWSTKKWTGLTNFSGSNVWTDGTDIYYSAGSSQQYILDKSTSTWSVKTWTGLTNFTGSYTWTDENNIYYSSSSDQYVLDKSTSTWSTKTWTGLTNFRGDYIWTYRTNIYYSSGSIQYVLDKSTSTWSAKTWNGLTNFRGDYIWTDGTDIYYSNGSSSQYVLDKSTSTWSAKRWTESTILYGNYIWTDGVDTYYSYNSNQYQLIVPHNLAAIDTNGDLIDSGKSISTFADKDNTVITGSISMGRKMDTVIGINSVAVGDDVTASEQYSHAEGWKTSATGMWSHAEGQNTTASDGAAHAEGQSTVASGWVSHAEGQNTTASNNGAHAEGVSTQALGFYAHAEGAGTTASGMASHAEGGGVVASGSYSHAEGDTTVAQLAAEHASGKYNEQYNEWTASTAYAVNDVVVNNSSLYKCTTAHTSEDSFDSTKWNDITDTSPIFVIGNGTAQNRHNTFVIFRNGAVAEGSNTIATEWSAHAEGGYTKATAFCAHAEGNDTTASKDYSHAEGQYTTASNMCAHAEGQHTTASGWISHAEGADSTAAGDYSHAEGKGTIAAGSFSHAGGQYNVEDDLPVWTSGTSYAVGDKVKAITNYGGIRTWLCKIANSDINFKDHKWEEIYGQMNYAEIIGNGRYNARSNARALDWDGNEYLRGNIYVGCNTDSTGGNKVATESYVTNSIGNIDLSTKADKNNTVITNSLSMGRSETGTVGTNSVATGSLVVASGAYSHAEGSSATASGAMSHAEGQGTKATGQTAHAEGNTSTASGQSTHAEGMYTLASDMSAHAEGYYTIASGQFSHAEGYGSSTSGAQNMASHTEGYCCTVASASQPGGHAEGYETRVTGSVAHAEGAQTLASGMYAHAEGSGTTASGQQAHAEGASTTASGNCSHAEGAATVASGVNSHAEGAGTIAAGVQSHAEGQSTIAASSAHAGGKYNVADDLPEWTANTSYAVGNKVKRTSGSGTSQTVTTYACKTANNDSTFTSSNWTNTYGEMNYAEIIGNGTADDARSNARALDWDGNEYLKGDLYVGCNADSTGGTKLEPLPAVTSSDNNKVLEVVNGEWVVGSKKSTANGIASLDSNGKVPGEQIIRPSSRFNSKTWTGLTNFKGQYIWTDGTDIYYSYALQQYILDKSASTWSTKKWTGLGSFSGGSIWTDGTNIYCSSGVDHYVLDKSTSTWSAKTWTGLTNYYGSNVWTDGINIYCSNGSNHYVLDKSTSTWSTKTWNISINFYGSYIWTDGTNIYCSSGVDHYVLDKSTSTWSSKTWIGLTNFNGSNVWTDKTDIYYSNGSAQYVLNKSTSTWSAKIWTGLTSFQGVSVWTDGTNYYYSNNSDQYQLEFPHNFVAMYSNGDLVDSGKSISDFIPANPPTTDGTYTLQCVVTNGVPTYSWIPMTNFVTLDT